MAGCEVRFKFYRGEAVKSRKGAVSGIVQALQINRSGQAMILVLYKLPRHALMWDDDKYNSAAYKETWFHEANFVRDKT